MTTKQLGDIAEASVAAAFLKAGLSVLFPWGDRHRYDLVVEEDNRFFRIQVKAGNLANQKITFRTCNVSTKNGKYIQVGYKGQIDFFAVYCPELDKVYIVPESECGSSAFCLRLLKSENNQSKGTHQANKYEFTGSLAHLVRARA